MVREIPVVVAVVAFKLMMSDPSPRRGLSSVEKARVQTIFYCCVVCYVLFVRDSDRKSPVSVVFSVCWSMLPQVQVVFFFLSYCRVAAGIKH